MACAPVFFERRRSLDAPERSSRRSCRFPRPGHAPTHRRRVSTRRAAANAQTAYTRTSKAQTAPADPAKAPQCARSTASRSPSSDGSSRADPSRPAQAATGRRCVPIARRSARDASASASMEHVCRPMESEFDPRHGRHRLAHGLRTDTPCTRGLRGEPTAMPGDGCELKAYDQTMMVRADQQG
jgi:hypothetical protein